MFLKDFYVSFDVDIQSGAIFFVTKIIFIQNDTYFLSDIQIILFSENKI